MELSKMFGVELDTDFGVKGHESAFKLTLNGDGAECLLIKWSGGTVWRMAQQETLCAVILRAPAGIIHLPPPLTDDQRTVLTAMYTLGYRWLAEDSDGIVYSYGNSKPEKWRYHWVPACREMYRIHEQMPESIVKSIVSWSDPEPLDIGKALGVEE